MPHAQARSLLTSAIHAQRRAIESALKRHVNEIANPAYENSLNTHAHERAYGRVERFAAKGGRLTPSILRPLTQTARALRNSTSLTRGIAAVE